MVVEQCQSATLLLTQLPTVRVALRNADRSRVLRDRGSQVISDRGVKIGFSLSLSLESAPTLRRARLI
jgi:hypothetical protein